MILSCLTGPIRLLGIAVLAAAGLGAWTYREEIRGWIHARTGPPAEAEPVGRADRALVSGARRRIDQLRRDGRDSVVLSAAETASLVDAALRRTVSGLADSVEAELGLDEITLRALVDTRRVGSLLGPLEAVLADRERVEARGPLIMRRVGQGEWQVRRVRLRALPLPADLVARMLGRPPETGPAVSIPLPPSVTGLRVTPRGVVLYGAGARTGGGRRTP